MLKVRKSITISRRADKHLRMLAEKKGKSQSKVIEELIEKEADEYDRDNKRKKLEAFERLLKLSEKIMLPENISIQKAKSEMER